MLASLMVFVTECRIRRGIITSPYDFSHVIDINNLKGRDSSRMQIKIKHVKILIENVKYKIVKKLLVFICVLLTFLILFILS